MFYPHSYQSIYHSSPELLATIQSSWNTQPYMWQQIEAQCTSWGQGYSSFLLLTPFHSGVTLLHSRSLHSCSAHYLTGLHDSVLFTNNLWLLYFSWFSPFFKWFRVVVVNHSKKRWHVYRSFITCISMDPKSPLSQLYVWPQNAWTLIPPNNAKICVYNRLL